MAGQLGNSRKRRVIFTGRRIDEGGTKRCPTG
jgi:hypothetical protein